MKVISKKFKHQSKQVTNEQDRKIKDIVTKYGLLYSEAKELYFDGSLLEYL